MKLRHQLSEHSETRQQEQRMVPWVPVLFTDTVSPWEASVSICPKGLFSETLYSPITSSRVLFFQPQVINVSVCI